MTIALFHPQHDVNKLEQVKSEMQTLGAPVIKGFWSENYGMWLAVEGCHRIRAAKELGIMPIMEQIESETVIIQNDGEDQEMNCNELEQELNDIAYRQTLIDFEE